MFSELVWSFDYLIIVHVLLFLVMLKVFKILTGQLNMTKTENVKYLFNKGAVHTKQANLSNHVLLFKM